MTSDSKDIKFYYHQDPSITFTTKDVYIITTVGSDYIYGVCDNMDDIAGMIDRHNLEHDFRYDKIGFIVLTKINECDYYTVDCYSAHNDKWHSQYTCTVARMIVRD